MPMTSPVERISGPSRVSASGKRSKGSTASLTLTWPPVRRRWSRPSARSSARVAPAMTRAATLASGTPVALDTNGTVRLARGLASITKTWWLWTAYCTLTRPRTSRASAMARVWPSMTSMTAGLSVGGGMTQALSPEWTPASSTCSMTAADDHLAGGVADGVDVDLDGVLEEAVDQHRPLGRQATLPPERAETGQLRPWPGRRPSSS